VIGGPIRHWLKGAELFKEPRIRADKYAHVIGRMEHRDEFEAILRASVQNWKKTELFQAGQERRLAFGYLASLSEAVASPQHMDREFFQEIDHPIVGKHEYCAAPFTMADTSWQQARAPLLGEHNEAVYQGDLGLSSQEMVQFQQEGVI
jgi:crotonobetainyl-CoA:carnitine CoA-transferase CaiB-like acyl-CoA transferase